MAALMGNTSSQTQSQIHVCQIDQVHRQKKKKKKPKLETETTHDTDMKFKGKWKVADVDYSTLKLDELREFMGIEELSTDHEVISGKPSTKRSRNRRRRHRVSSHLQPTTVKRKDLPVGDEQILPKKKKIWRDEPGPAPDQSTVGPALSKEERQEENTRKHLEETVSTISSVMPRSARKKAKLQNQSDLMPKRQQRADEDVVGKKEKTATESKRRKEDVRQKENSGKEQDGRNLTSKKNAVSFTKGIPVPKQDQNVNMSAWKNLYVPAPVLKALQDLGFREPTPIQKATIPAAIKDGKDIVGAAETGSGKTLAFSIPVIHNILQHKAAQRREARSAAFKQATTGSTVTTKPALPSNEMAAKARGLSPKKKGKLELGQFDAESPAGRKRIKGKPDDEMRRNQKGKIETEEKISGDDDDDEEEEGEEDSDQEEEDIDDEDDEDIEYDFDEEDDDKDIDYDEDEDEDDGDDDEDIDFQEEEDEDEEDFGKMDDDSSSDGHDDDTQDTEKSIQMKKKQKQKRSLEKQKLTDEPVKKPKGKKGQKQRKFRVKERKMLELDGAEFEGVELINKMDKHGFGCVRAIDDISDAELLAQVGLGKGAHQIEEAKDESKDDRQLQAMVLTPTRELAVQVKNHLVAVTKYTDIKVAVIVGGMSAQKQERLLKRHPEIVVGTPGRIWELFREGEPHLSTMSGVRCLVLDEADRMVEKGHYEQLTEILQHLNHSPTSLHRQTLVFSATLTLVHLGPDRKALANKAAKRSNPKQEKKDRKEKLNSLMKKVGMRDNPAVVDLTEKQGTVASLMEAKIICDITDKDIYLYYFLLQFPGRTLVFSNSIDCIRRLCSILSLLACNPLPLHSSMHQKQRLKNLDRFAANPKALLLATDVAARGLDIPDVQHVIHYQVPRTSETYIHRSGRTARQAKEGISVMLVSPSEAHFYKRVCRTLKRDDIPSFPVDHTYFNAVKERVDLARLIDQTSHRMEKKKHANDWFIKAAKELDVDLDEDLVLHDLGDSHEQMQHGLKIQHMKGDLKKLLKRTIFPWGSSWLYPTAAGRLVSPLTQGSASAVTVVKSKLGKRTQGGRQQDAEPPRKVKKSKNKFKRADDA